MVEEPFTPGEETFVAHDSPVHPHSVFFEDDGQTGYFYALDLSCEEDMILDAVHIYNVADAVDRDRPSQAKVIWSDDGLKSVLLINGYPHAAFDFQARRGYCRNNFPNFPAKDSNRWHREDHEWSESAISWLS